MVEVKQVMFVCAPNSPKQAEEDEVLFLSNIDQHHGYYVHSLFFFRSSSRSCSAAGLGPSLDALTEQLRSGLSNVLLAYPSWAGRLRLNPSSNKLEVVCNNKGARLAAAVYSRSISELELELSSNAVDLDQFFLEPAQDIASLDDLPLLNIQVTQMEGCNGYAISFLTHHTLTDATTAIFFQLNFAHRCRGEELFIVPQSDRTALKARNPPTPAFDHPEFGKQDAGSRFTVTPASVLASQSLRKKLARSSKQERRKYLLDPKDLARIKSAARDGLCSQDGRSSSDCSTFEALAAHVWRAHTAARYGYGGECSDGSDRSVKVRFPISTRKILNPPLGDGFCGNAVHVAKAQVNLGQLASESLATTVRRIQEAKARITDEYVRSGLDFLELHPDYWSDPNCDTLINGWPRAMGLWKELDFGFGMPYRAEFPMHPGNSAIILFPPDEAGLLISVSLEPSQFPTFDKCLLNPNSQC